MNNNIGDKYLPIGTVVMLKNGSKRLMITGFCSVSENDVNKIFDYSGCLYPEGIISSNQTALFNHEQIDVVYHLGLANDDEEKKFKAKLVNAMNQISFEKSQSVNNETLNFSKSDVSNQANIDELNI